jgi:hypothetical protein
MELLPTDNPSILAYWRVHDETDKSDRVLCIYNLSNQQQSLSLDLVAYRGQPMTDLLVSGEDIILGDWPTVKILRPYASHWLRID